MIPRLFAGRLVVLIGSENRWEINGPSALVAKNVNIATIQRPMCHASISMTEMYLHISNELKADAVERLVG